MRRAIRAADLRGSVDRENRVGVIRPASMPSLLDVGGVGARRPRLVDVRRAR